MSSNPLLLNGRVQPDEVSALNRKINRLEDEVTELKEALREARQQGAASNRARARLQQQLEPLKNAILGIFEELEDVSISDGVRAASEINPKWDKWMRDLGGAQAEIIAALLQHENLSVKQMMAACKRGENTVYDATSKLGRLGLIQKNGGKFSLKEI